MKFSLTAASIFAFACLSSVKADSYSDAIKEYCDGMSRKKKNTFNLDCFLIFFK
jgi:hypothetical protein